jgi:hypothetical protein
MNNTKRALIGGIIAAVIGGTGAAAIAVPAFAHTPSVVATCSSLDVNLTNYSNSHQDDEVNTVTVTIDGAAVVPTTDFGSSYTYHADLASDTAHTYDVNVTAWDDADGKKGYTKDFPGTTTACVTETPTPTPTPTQTTPTIPVGQPCLPNGNPYSEDVAPTQTADGLLYTGQSNAVDQYQPVSGNLQGLGDQSLTFKNVAGYQPSFTLVLWRNLGGGSNTDYANLVTEWYMNGGSPSTDGTYGVSAATSKFWTNKIASGAGSQSDPQPLSFFVNLWPNNALISMGAHLGSGQTSDTHSVVTAETGCVNVSFVPTPVQATVVPTNPIVKDKCGTENDHYGLPDDTDAITYWRDGNDVTATIKADNTVWGTLPSGWVKVDDTHATYPFSATEWTNVPCDEGTPTPTPTPTQTTGTTPSPTPSASSTPVTTVQTTSTTPLAQTGSDFNPVAPLVLGVGVGLGGLTFLTIAFLLRRRESKH